MIKPMTKNILANESVNGPRFNFYNYTVGATYYNNGTIVDFITDGNDLYVCGIEEVTVTAPDIKDQPNLIKLISKGIDGQRGPQGAQGRPGHSPKITAKFDGKQMIIYADGNRIAVTNDLTGPSWKPERQGNTIVWNRTKDDEQPAPIDLNELRAEDYKPVLFRVDSDNTKRSDEESGPANFIQWKYEGDEFWTNLIAIDDLLNIALAGVCTWKSEEDGNWHIGHKEVVKATYDSTKDGKRIISQVELGDVLFDAGPIVPDMQIDIDYLEAKLNEIEEVLKGIDIPSLDGYATEDWVNAQGFLKNVPEVDAYTKAQSDAKFQPKGNYVKSVNNHTPDANGNVTITLGDFDLTAYVKKSDLATINSAVLYNGGNIDISGGTVIGLQDVEVSVSNGKLRYRKKENGTWGSYTNIMDVPASTGDGDTVNGFVNVSLSGNVLTFTRQDGTTKEITLPSSGDGQGCEYCWTEDQILELVNGALSNYYTKSQVYTKGEIDAMIGGSTNSYRTFMIFKRSASSTSETLPTTTITWNITQGELDIPSGSNGWTEHPSNATSQAPYLWMASASFQSIDGERVGNWDGPFCLTGEDGKDGVDGTGIEFAYILCTKAEYNSLKNTTPVAEHGDGRADDLPSGSTASGNTWTDHPSGISEEFPIEAVTIRKKTNGTWSAYSKPTIWSMWGEDGVDGDGVEYIFFVAAEDIVIVDTATGKFTLDPSRYLQPSSPNFIPTDQQMVIDLGLSYQKSDWISNVDNNWTDNPSDIDENQPFEFVSIRKYTDENGWGPFCKPKLWGHFGGITITQTETVYGSTNNKPYTCYAFHRDANDLSDYSVVYDFSAFGVDSYSELTDNQKNMFYTTPQNYAKTLDANNNVVSIVWQDTVPVGNDQLWLITAHIGDENQASDTGWTSPVRWGDRAGFQVEYSNDDKAAAVYANPGLWNNNHLTLNDFSGTDEEREAEWEEAVRTNYGVWGDNIEDPIYMATSVLLSSGVWSNWTVAKIKGENGKDGTNGTAGSDGNSIEFVYYRTKGTEPGIEVVDQLERGTYDPEDASVRNKTDKDAWRDKFFPAVSIGTKTDEGGDYWHDHPSGVNEVYTHEWVAMRTSAIQDGRRYWSSNFSISLWSKFGADGRDGDGIEYVFWGLSEEDVLNLEYTWPTQQAANAANNGHNVDPERLDDAADRAITDPEYLPALLMKTGTREREAVDNNPGITDNKYVYASMRKYNGTTKTWGEFSEIKLWNEQSDSELNRCVLQIENDSESVLVNDLNVVDDSFNTFDINVDDLWLRNNTTLLNIDKIAVNGVDFVTFSGQSITPISGASATIELDATHNLYVTYAGAYVSSDRYNTKSIRLTLTFTDNSEIVAPIAIPISAYSGDFIGTDLLTIFPVNTNELVKLSTTITKDFYTSTRGSYDYDQSTIGISTSEFYQSPIKAVEKINYWVAFDQPKDSAFTSGTSYFGPFSVPNAEREGAPGVNGTLEYDYYFTNDRRLQNNRDAETLIHIRMYHTGNEMRDTNQWNGYADVYFGDHSVDPNNGFLPIDNIIIGIGYPNSSNTPVVTDREEYKIIYNGSTGPQGPQGQEGPQGPKGEDGTTTTVHEYQYLDNPVMRMGVWSASNKYYAGNTRIDDSTNEPTGNETGTKYLDVVKYSLSTGDDRYYKCVSNVTSTPGTSPNNDSTHWELFTAASDTAMANLIVNNSAFINSLTAHQVVITDSNNNIVAGMTSSDDAAEETNLNNTNDVIIWAGTPESGSTDINAAPFTVTETGAVKASNIDLAGGNISGTLDFGQSGTLRGMSGTIQGTFDGRSLNFIDTAPLNMNNAIDNIYIDCEDGIRSTHQHVGNSGTSSSSAKLDSGEINTTSVLSARGSYSDITGTYTTPNANLSVTMTGYGITRVTPTANMDAVFSNNIGYIRWISESDYNSLSSYSDSVLYIIIDND